MLFSEAQLNLGDYFAEEDRFENSIGFLRQGMIRAFYRSPDGMEYNKTFLRIRSSLVLIRPW
jgi:hypothetical protein